MLDLRNDFRLKSKADLEKLSSKINTTKDANLPDEILHEAFRKFHTIKGTAQTFGFVSAGRIAHALEDLLAGIGDGPAAKEPLLDGIHNLINSLERNPDEPEDLHGEIAVKHENPGIATIFVSKIRPEEFERLAEHEKDRMITAAADKEIASLDTPFEKINLAKQLTDFRTRLAAHAEIIASIPCISVVEDGMTGLRTYFTADEISPEIKAVADAFSSHIDLHTVASRNTLNELIREIGRLAAGLSRQLEKEVRILVSTNNFDLPKDRTGLLFDILLHLVRNAIDHASGLRLKIMIDIETKADGMKMTFSDNGSGVDVEKIRAKAIDRGLLKPETTVSDCDLMNLIFLPAFSTADAVTDISGRGYGLDAARKSITDVNGTIKVASKMNEGTTFEVYLPSR